MTTYTDPQLLIGLTHDPEMPWVFRHSSGDKALARFRREADANLFASQYAYGSVVNTTPPPRIPEHARYITWTDSSFRTMIACLASDDSKKTWRVTGETGTCKLSDLLNYIGDAEITVLSEPTSAGA